jgi:endonuclease G, mitochondrial
MPTFEVARARQQDAAAKRVTDRTGVRRGKIDLLSQDGWIVQADSPERIATRIDRPSRYHPEIVPFAPTAIEEREPAAMAAASTVLERIIIPAISSAWRTSRPVLEQLGPVNIRDEGRGRAPPRCNEFDVH